MLIENYMLYACFIMFREIFLLYGREKNIPYKKPLALELYE